jgi:cellulose synthase/poly-beta-1,6-N-acetylglucosamine synthase-like glycosyltransferase
MYSLLLAIFCVSTFLVLHTYLFYPLIMMLLFPKARLVPGEYQEEEELPEVAILIAAYNEEKVIAEKIVSVFNSGYPENKIRVFVGSDASSDRTDEKVQALKQRYPAIDLVRFEGRIGKIGIVNRLQKLVHQDLVVLTDANVFFRPGTLFELVKKFRDERVGLVAANIIKVSDSNEGISLQEKKYISLENKIKTGESHAFNLIMGAEGGCYAIRNALFTPVPDNFIVDDFFITLSVLHKNKFALFNPAAICYEDVPSDMAGEYRRKVRISSGNFQNLFFFRSLLLQFWKPVCFAFWSHKVLRWLTPFLLFISLLSSSLLIPVHPVFILFFLVQLLGLLMPLLNRQLKFRSAALKYVSHFYLMNFALLEGFVKFAKGIKSSVWQPVNRNV